jgi:hypothetical protein
MPRKAPSLAHTVMTAARCAAATAQTVPALARKVLPEGGPGIGSRLQSACVGAIRGINGTRSGNAGTGCGNAGAFPMRAEAEKRLGWRFLRQRKRWARHGWHFVQRRKGEKPLTWGYAGVA